MDEEIQENPLVTQAKANRAQNSDKIGKFQDLSVIVAAQDATQKAIIKSIEHLITFINQHEPKTEVTNQPESITVDNLKEVTDALGSAEASVKQVPEPIVAALEELGKKLEALDKEFPDMPEPVEEVTVKNMVDPRADIQEITKAIKAIKIPEPQAPTFDPTIEVAPTPVTVNPTDLTPVKDLLQKLLKAFESFKIPETKIDLTPLALALQKVQNSIDSLVFPVPNYILPFKNRAGAATQAQLSSDGSSLLTASGLAPFSYDEIDLSNYGGSAGNLPGTITYKAAGATLATLTLTYVGDNIASIVRA